MSQDRLGASVHVSGDLVHKIELGDRRPSRVFAGACDGVLQAGGMLIQLWRDIESETHLERGQMTVTDSHPVGITSQPEQCLPPGIPDVLRLTMMNVAGEHVEVALATEVPSRQLDSYADSTEHVVIPCRTSDGRIMWVAVPRRNFLFGGMGIVAAAAIPAPSQSTPLAKGALNFGLDDASPFERFDYIRIALRDSDNLLGSSHVIPILDKQIRALERLSGSVRGADHTRLLSIQVQFADLYAWLYQDCANYRDAQFWLDRALEWAQICEDHATAAFILARKSQLAGQGNQTTHAIDMAQAAISLAEPGSRAAAIAATYAAHGYALSGDKNECQRSYDHAYQLLDQAKNDATSWFGRFLNPAYIEVQRAHSLSVLGDHQAASDAFGRAIDSLPASYHRDRGVYLARKAVALAGYASDGTNRDPEETALESAATGSKALAICLETNSVRIMTELFQLNGQLSRWRDNESVGDLLNRIGAAHSESTS